MKSCRLVRTATVGSLLCCFFSLSLTHSQDRPPRSSQPSAEEKLLLDDANRERAAAGLQPLKWDNALATAARQHALLMAQQYQLSHQYPGELPLEERAAQNGAKFSLIAENVAVGPTPDSIHEGWMHSPGHRKNILNAEVSAVGIATVRVSDGLFAVQDFSRPIADLSLQQQEEKVISLLRRTGLMRADASEEARKACGMNRGLGGTSALYVMRFEATDLSKLPEPLMRNLKNGTYRKASVGACHDNAPSGFTRYRIAVLLN
ncbi:MAG TPA: CAP domain-containing protein [Candidatus Acidoferrum sp.]|nr:CAP domain-containing protein [Candidatus Acidoferrum sp.]